MRNTFIKHSAKQLLLIIVIYYCSSGCNKILDVDNPTDKIVGDDLFKDKESAESAILGIYSAISDNSNIFAGAITFYTAIYGDEADYTGQAISSLEFYQGSVSTTNSFIETNFWATTYRLTYQINASLEILESSKSLPLATKNQLRGECKFLRAFIYFQMIQLFGEVPLITGTDYRMNENMGRTNINSIKEQILSDLTSAKELLSDAYPGNEKSRANKWTAATLLARYYLYQQSWAKAEEEASEIINTGHYRLTEPDKVFLANSSEAIFQIQPVRPGYNTMEGNAFIPSELARPSYTLTMSLINAFELNDKRWPAWVKSKEVNGTTYYYPFKYKKKVDFSSNFSLTEYSMIFRLSEVLLIRAESRVFIDLLPDAIADLDTIRQRAGLPLISVTYPGISGIELIEKIQQERRIEFFTECGHRWFDLKRTGKAYTTLLTMKPSWKVENGLWPIPQAQISLNPNLDQNPGY
ncbi:RagB/SusD family nutrient uptake outer membrane protein [Chitinophaga sp. S165]|uniref:RagB/SusD family nutrient uptake outer membrane protein n=1 Tax=Chitinophaga sp. S165 TaxID=2135462 RepID=UPI000D71C909|nr:RagB/SusD family nutrient uptake outer membrane protein [Chitinophaga sp. S165]PWV56259.1 putative outer membrane starch-binding protein [Chitinophaga sp. S165]